jgi:signal transduction histidine kinase
MRDEDKTKQQLMDELAQMRQALAGAEDALQACTDELKQSRQEFRLFTYIVSHDLRTPLINLRGFSAELRYTLETIQSAFDVVLPLLDEEQRTELVTAVQQDVPEALGFIEFSVSHIDNFINAVLQLSRLSRRELKFEPIDMDDLVREILTSLPDQIEQQQVEITLEDLPDVVADRDSIELIMSHILTNAVIYLDPSRPGEIKISGERGPDETIFCVSDNGRGIAEEDMHKVFEPFRRAGRQDVPGQGMGLAYAQTMARRHDGYIDCVSEIGVGTTFTCVISNHLLKGDGYAE